MVQVIVNARADWSDDQKQEIATGLTEAVRRVLTTEGEVSVWFQAYDSRDVYVGAEAASEQE